jgi:hypothetical protein
MGLGGRHKSRQNDVVSVPLSGDGVRGVVGRQDARIEERFIAKGAMENRTSLRSE